MIAYTYLQLLHCHGVVSLYPSASEGGRQSMTSDSPMKTLLLIFLFAAGSSFAQAADGSAPPPSEPSQPVPEVALTGTLVRVAAIGGETSGWALSYGENQRVELVLPVPAPDWIREGIRVTVVGRYGTRMYIERGEVRVLLVLTIDRVTVPAEKTLPEAMPGRSRGEPAS